MNQVDKVAVRWLELLTIILLTLAGMVMWILADWSFSALAEDGDLRLEEFEQPDAKKDLQQRLALAQNELAVVENKLIEQHLEAARQNFYLATMTEAQPELLKVPVMISETMLIPSEAIQTYLNLQFDIKTTIKFIDKLEAEIPVLAAALATASAMLKETRRASSEEVPVAVAEVAAAKEDLALARQKLIEKQLELARQAAVAETMTDTYPELAKIVTSTQTLSLSTGILHNYFDTQLKLAATQTLSQALALQLTQVTSQTTVLSKELNKQEKEATRQFNLAQDDFRQRKNWTILALTVIFILIFFSIIGRVKKLEFHRPTTFWGAGILLAVLLAYQMFAMVGAVIVGVYCLIVAIAEFRRSQSAANITPGETP